MFHRAKHSAGTGLAGVLLHDTPKRYITTKPTPFSGQHLVAKAGQRQVIADIHAP